MMMSKREQKLFQSLSIDGCWRHYLSIFIQLLSFIIRNYSNASHVRMVSSAFARARSTLPLTGCSSLFSLSRASLRSRLLRSVSANRFAHLSSNANSTISSSSTSSSSSLLLLLKNTISDVALKFSFLFSLLCCILLLFLLSGGGQDTNVSQERESEDEDDTKGCRTPKFGGPRKRISADGGGSSHAGGTCGSKSFGRRVIVSSSTVVVSRRRRINKFPSLFMSFFPQRSRITKETSERFFTRTTVKEGLIIRKKRVKYKRRSWVKKSTHKKPFVTLKKKKTPATDNRDDCSACGESRQNARALSKKRALLPSIYSDRDRAFFCSSSIYTH